MEARPNPTLTLPRLSQVGVAREMQLAFQSNPASSPTQRRKNPMVGVEVSCSWSCLIALNKLAEFVGISRLFWLEA